MVWDDFNSKKNSEGGDFKGPEIKLPNINFPKIKFPIYLIILVPLLLYIGSGSYYIVEQDEVGVVLNFGVYKRTSEPGIHFKFPPPIEVVYTPKVTEVKREEVGFRIEYVGPPARYRDIAAESIMLTGDENIVDLDVIAQYKILDPVNYLFNVANPRRTLHVAAEASIREVIGSHGIDDALTEGKSQIEEEVRILVQYILDKYNSGLLITAIKLQDVHPPQEVKAAFKDVASAREDKNRLVNEAEGYKNALMPEARGEAAKILNKALGYREEKINHAKGDAERFMSLLKEYKGAQEITKKRLYLDTMEEVLKDVKKYIMSDKDGVMPLLHLGDTGLKKTGRKKRK